VDRPPNVVYAGINSTPESTTALSRAGAVTAARNRPFSFQMFARSVAGEGNSGEACTVGVDPTYVAA
jgi:hypothetical protein